MIFEKYIYKRQQSCDNRIRLCQTSNRLSSKRPVKNNSVAQKCKKKTIGECYKM